MPEQIPRDEPTIVSGDRLVEDSSHKIIADVHDEILAYYPSATPLITFTGKLKKKRQVHYYKYEHLEVDKYPRTVTLSADALATATSIVVETGDYPKLAKNYHLLNTRTRTQVVVTATPTTTTVAIANVGAAAPMTAGDTLEFIAPVHQEADTLGSIKSIKETKLENYTEIIRTPMGWSRRTADTGYYGGNDPKKVRARTGLEHKVSIERAFLFGKRYSRTTADSKLQTFTGGAEYWIKSNVWNLGGQSLTERGLVEYLEYAMELGDGGYLNGPGIKTAMCGREFMTVLEFWGRDKIRYEPLSSKLGMRAAQFVCSHGTINIVPNPQLTGDHAGWCFLFDMNHLWYVYHKNGDTKLLRNRHARSFDGSEEEYLSDVGLMLDREASHGLIKL
jgi:hypothetical protein